MNNQERAAEVLRDDKHYKMGPHGEQFLTSEAARSLADAGLLIPDKAVEWAGDNQDDLHNHWVFNQICMKAVERLLEEENNA